MKPTKHGKPDKPKKIEFRVYLESEEIIEETIKPDTGPSELETERKGMLKKDGYKVTQPLFRDIWNILYRAQKKGRTKKAEPLLTSIMG
jgi:hypothetical protein